MASDLILRSYGDNSQAPDVLGLIEVLTATEDSVQNTLGKRKQLPRFMKQ